MKIICNNLKSKIIIRVEDNGRNILSINDELMIISETGVDILKFLNDEMTSEQIINNLTEIYNADFNTIEADYYDFVEQMINIGIIDGERVFTN